MGTFKFACKMLKREKRQAISYGVTVLFTVFVSFIFFNIIALFKKIVALGYLIQRIYHNDIRNMLP